MPEHTRTVCLEFFGNAKGCVPSIVDIKDLHVRRGKALGVQATRSRRAWSTWTTAI